MPDTNLSNGLSLLSQSQLDTITYESGVEQNGAIPGNPGVPAAATFWAYSGDVDHTWQTALGVGVGGITYAFATSTTGTQFSGPDQSAAVQALALWSDIANINFMASPTGVTGSDVTFELASNSYAGAAPLGTGTLYSRIPANDAPTSTRGLTQETAGIVQFDNSGTYGDPGSYLLKSGYGVSTLVHEVGHLLGLGHTGPYNADSNGFADSDHLAVSTTDVRLWSIMSYVNPDDPATKFYNDYTPTSLGADGTRWSTETELATAGNNYRAPFTPMGLDIFAAQRLYGAPTNGVLSGGQTFGFNSNIMYTASDGTQQPLSMYDFGKGYDVEPVVTLYDYGANNTLDLSGFSDPSTIDLNSGAWSSAAGLINNIFIEYGTAIDTVIGGSGNDTFTVNADSDIIDGGPGSDTVVLPGPEANYGLSGPAATPTLTDLVTGSTYALTNIEDVKFSQATVGDTPGDITVAVPDLAATLAPSMAYGWAPSFGDGDWTASDAWVALPVSGDLVTGTVPGAGAAAYVVAGATDQPEALSFPTTVSVTSSQTVTTLGLGGFGLFGAAAIFPTIDVQGASVTLDVTGSVLDNFTGVFPDPIDSQTFSGGGTIDLANGATLAVGGTVAAGIVVLFGDASADMLQLGGVSGTAPAAFAGTIEGFVQGDTIELANLQATSADYNAGVLSLIAGGVTVATLDVPGDFNRGNFGVTSTPSGTAVTEQPTTVGAPPAGSITWSGPSGADWNNPADFWSVNGQPAGRQPDDTDDVAIGDGDSVNVTNEQTNEVDSLQIASGATLSLDFDGGHFFIGDANMASMNSGEVDIGDNAVQVEVYLSGTFINDGLIQFFGAGAYLQTNDHTVTVGGTGTISMQDGDIGGRTFATSFGVVPNDTLVNLGNTIQGSGVIGNSPEAFLYPLTFINDNIVDANMFSESLSLSGGVVNKGTLESSDGGILLLTGVIDSSTNFAGTGTGQIEALDGSTVQIGDATITGGALTQSGTGKIEITGDTKFDGTPNSGGSSGVVLTGDVVVDAGAALTLSGKITGGEIDATEGKVQLSGVSLSGVQMKGNVGFGGGGNTIWATNFDFENQFTTDIGGLSVGGGSGLTLAPAYDGSGNDSFVNSSVFTLSGAGAVLNIAAVIVIDGGVIRMTDPTDVIAGTPGGSGFQNYDELIIEDGTISGVGLITGMELQNTSTGTIMATGGTLIVNSGTDVIIDGGGPDAEETVSDGWIGAAANSDLVIMGRLDLQANIIDGSSPGGEFSGAGTITLGGSIITGARAGTIVGGTIEAGRTIQVVAPGGGLESLTVDGEVDVNGGALLTLYGGQQIETDNPGMLTNAGSIVLNQAATLAPVGDMQVGGGGTIRLESDGGARIVSITSFDTLENTGDTIEGAGTLGGSYLNLFNDSTIAANVSGKDLVVDGGSLSGTAGQIYNSGLMVATGGGTLAIDGAVFNYGLFFEEEGVPAETTGGGDIGASGPGSVIDLNGGAITGGRLWTENGALIEVTANSTIGGGDQLVPAPNATTLGGTPDVVNETIAGPQSNGAVAGLTSGRIVVAWDDYGVGTNGSPTTEPATGATLYPPVVRFAVLDALGTKLTTVDLTAQSAPSGTSQSDPEVAALTNGGFVITWLQSAAGSGVMTLCGVTYNVDLSVAGSGFSIPVSGAGTASQDVAGMKDGGFAVVWADAAPFGNASPIHLERFGKTGLGGSVVDIGSGVAPTIALAGNGSGAYAVTWLVPGAGGEGTVLAQFFNAAGVAAGAPVTVGTGDSPKIAPGQNGNAFIVLWNDPVNQPGVPQGQEFQANGQLSGVGITTAAELDYGGMFTASSAALKDGRVATARSEPRDSSAPGDGNTDVGVVFSAPQANADEFVSYANIVVAAGHTLTLQEGMYNVGTIALPGGAGAVLAISGLAALSGTGNIVLGGAADAISGATGSDTLNLEGSNILGQGTIGGNNLKFENSGTVDATGGTLVVGTGGTLLNLAVMKASGGTLVINGPVANDGVIESTNTAGFGEVVINGPVLDEGSFTGFLELGGGEMVLAGAVGATRQIFFSATDPGTLVLSDPLQMKGTISFLNPGNTIDVVGVAATGFSYDPSSETLDLLSGASTLDVINLGGVSSLGSLTVASDNHGNTLVELVPVSDLGFGVNASVAGLPGGGFVEIYQPASFDDSPPTGVYATIFNAHQSEVAQSLVDPSGQQPAVAAQRDGQFMVVWVNATTNTIQGRIYSAGGTLLKATFDLTQAVAGWTQTNPSISIVPSGSLGDQYEFAYETDNAGTGETAVVALTLDGNGVATAPPTVVTSLNLDVLDVTYAITDPQTPRAVAQQLSSPLEVEVFASMAQSPEESSAFNAIVGEFVVGAAQSGAAIAGSDGASLPVETKDSNSVTIMFTPPDTNMTYVSPEIAALTNGDLVAVWDQIGPADATWTVAGQVVTSSGVFVGSGFTIATGLPAAVTPARPAINALPNGDFVVTYNAAAGSLSGQKYDTSGNPIGDPFAITNASDGDPSTTVLSDGTLLTVSGSEGFVSAGTFSVQAVGATWGGASGTDMGTAGNWQPMALPDATETLTFNAAAGGTLTGTATGMNAVFSGTGAWLLQGATVSLAGEALSPGVVLALTDNGALTVNGGSLAAAGSLDIETITGAAMAVRGGAQVSAEGMALGIGGGQGGTLAVGGLGTAIQNTGTNGSAEIGGSGSGQIGISGGASVTNAAGATLGVNAGGDGSLALSGAGSLFSVTGELDVGVAGSGHLNIENQATVVSGNNPASPSQGFDVALLPGGAGDATVTGIGSLLSNTGRFIVGDAGVGSLSIAAGATVTTTPGIGGVGLTIANTTSASGSSVNVSGAGSDLAVTGTLIVGSSGYGSLSLSQGATVTAASLDVAAASSGDGAISIAGSGTTLDITGSLTLGDQAAGELSILGGAQMTIAGGEIGGSGIDGTGNLDIEDAGSTLTINGGTLLVGANGPAEFTLGIGGTLDGEVSTEPNGVTNLYGNVDPATLLNDGAENIGNSQGGTSQSDDFYIANSGTITIKGTATFYTPLVTFETAAADGSTTGLWVIAAKDTLVMNAASADASQTFDFTSATAAELVIGQVPSGPNINNLDTMVQNGTTMTTPLLTNSPVLGASALGTWAAPIENYQVGDTIVLQGLTYGSASASGDVVTVWSGEPNVSNALGSLVFVDKSGSTTSAASLAEAAAAAAQITPLPCFAAGTRIATADGLVKVERLAVGDRVRTVLGGAGSAGSGRDWVQGDAERAGLGGPGRAEARADQYEPVVWVGSRAVNCVRHPKPETVWPVRVRAGAFGDGMPVRDLWLSPDHAVYVDGVLVPVKLLVNGTSIAQVKRNHVVYYHVELPEHAVILAEGLTVESYLDTGDRANFSGSETIRLYPDFAARLDAAMTWEAKGAAPLVMTGPALEAARRRIADNASRCCFGIETAMRRSGRR